MVLDIVFLLILVISVMVGIKRGFVKTAFGIVSLFASILAAVYLYRPFIDMLYGIPVISGFIDTMIENTERIVFSALSSNGETAIPPIFMAVLSDDVLSQGLQMAAHTIAEAILSCVLIIIFIILIRIALLVVSKTLNLFTKLPVIKSFNGLLGGITGAVSGVLICYVVAVGLFMFTGTDGGAWINNSLATSVIAKRFFETNILISLLFGN